MGFVNYKLFQDLGLQYPPRASLLFRRKLKIAEDKVKHTFANALMHMHVHIYARVYAHARTCAYTHTTHSTRRASRYYDSVTRTVAHNKLCQLFWHRLFCRNLKVCRHAPSHMHKNRMHRECTCICTHVHAKHAHKHSSTRAHPRARILLRFLSVSEEEKNENRRKNRNLTLLLFSLAETAKCVDARQAV